MYCLGDYEIKICDYCKLCRYITVFITMLYDKILITNNTDNLGVFGVILFYIILYLFFIHSMNVKMACGKNTSLLEIVKYGAFLNPYSYK